MTTDLVLVTDAPAVLLEEEAGDLALPRIITDAGPQATKRFLEFFTVTICNKNTRRAYARAALQFLSWCEGRGIIGNTTHFEYDSRGHVTATIDSNGYKTDRLYNLASGTIFRSVGYGGQ